MSRIDHSWRVISITAAVCAIIGGSVAGLLHEMREESALSELIGGCFSTGAGAIGRMIYVADSQSVSLAFPSGNIVRYPFVLLTSVGCPSGVVPVHSDRTPSP